MLTPKERLKAIFEGQKVDRPACICPGGMMNMITADLMDQIQVFLPEAHHDARQMAELAKAVYEQGCFENPPCGCRNIDYPLCYICPTGRLPYTPPKRSERAF